MKRPRVNYSKVGWKCGKFTFSSMPNFKCPRRQDFNLNRGRRNGSLSLIYSSHPSWQCPILGQFLWQSYLKSRYKSVQMTDLFWIIASHLGFTPSGPTPIEPKEWGGAWNRGDFCNTLNKSVRNCQLPVLKSTTPVLCTGMPYPQTASLH